MTHNIIHLDETQSTNSYLNNLCLEQEVSELTTVWANFQTAGRGQRGNSWESEPNANLLFSFVLHPSFIEERQQFHISQLVALSIQEALSQYTDDITIKWPNDIYWKNKKIAGILIENDLCGHHISRSIAGIGLNINQQKFISDAPNPVSLYQIIGQTFNRREILETILDKVAAYYDLLKQNNITEIEQRYMNALFRKSGYHTYRDAIGIFLAEIKEIEGSGKLILKDTEGNMRCYFFKVVECII